MVDKTLSDLPAATSVDNTDLALVRQGAFDRKAEVGLIRAGSLQVANNLSDLDDVSAAVTNLGIDTSNFAATNDGNDFSDNIQENMALLQYSEITNAYGATGTAQTLDLNDGHVFTATVDDDVTFTFAGSKAGATSSFTLILTDGGDHAVTWPTSVDWAGGTAPTLTSSGVDVLTFFTTNNGTTWYGFLAGVDFS